MPARIAIVATILTVSFAGAACAEPPLPVTPQQAAVIDASCTSIMGLRKGDFQYLTCRDSLSNTAAALIQGEARLKAYDSCHDQGLAPGSAALATCMLDSEQANPLQFASVTATQGPMALPHGDLQTGSSYFGVVHAVQWRREQYSCAQLGIVPGSAAFGHCVASLDADLQATAQP